VLVAWVLFPLLLAALCLGCGLAVQALTRRELPGALLSGIGLAAIVVLASLLTLSDATAKATTPAVVALALLGGAVGWRNRRRPSGWAITAAVGVFAIYAAPIVLSGEATLAGYIRLDDSATWLALTDRVMESGRSLDGLAPSTYEATLAINLGDGYPIGAFMPLGVAGELAGTDIAWLIQPYMAFLAALLALALWQLAAAVVPSPRARTAIAFIAAQPALLYGYYLWGGVKELLAIALAATAAALVPAALGRPRRRGGAPLLIVLGALAASLSAIVAGHLLPPTSLPLTDSDALGNLAGPLDPLQLAGVWPTGDFRFPAEFSALTDLAMAIAIVAAAVGVAFAWRRRAWPVIVFCGGALAFAAGIAIVGSPWAEGKAFAIASVAVPFAAGLGAAALWAGRARIPAVLLAFPLAGGVLWSNALAYRDADLAPRDSLAELEEIGHRIAGEGPTLMTEYGPYGARHFLRDADPESVSELRRRTIPLRGGGEIPKGLSADTDELLTPGLLVYRTLVLHRSPSASRPPAQYRLTWRGDDYEVWQRPDGPPPPLRRLPLGSRFDPTGVARCRDVRALARAGGPILLARRARPVVVSLANASHPESWEAARPGLPIPVGAGSLEATINVRAAGEYSAWLRGSIKSEGRLVIDGEEVGSVRHILNNQGQYIRFGSVSLNRGRHRLHLRIEGADLHPGSGGQRTPIGPIVLTRGEAHDARVERVRASQALGLCGQRYDWLELSPGRSW
jgi:MYXO-CTERM domain-containing protein